VKATGKAGAPLIWAGLLALSCGGSASGTGLAGDGDGDCPTGDETCACYGNDTCRGDLVCLSGLCVEAGEGDGDGDGDGDGTGASPSDGGSSVGGSQAGAGGSVNLGVGGGAGAGGSGGAIGSGGQGHECSTSLVPAAALSLRWKTAWPGLDWNADGYDALDMLDESTTLSELVAAAHTVAEHIAWGLILDPGALACAMETPLSTCRTATIGSVDGVGTSRAFSPEEVAEFETLFATLEASDSRAAAQRFTLVAMLVSPASLYEE
jgi:hypothetical protein